MPALSLEAELEEVLLAAVLCDEAHLTANAGKGAGAAGDRQRAVLLVVERTLDGDLTAIQERRPQAFPDAVLDVQARAEPLVVADLVGVGLIEHRVRERQDVAGLVLASGRQRLFGVGDGVLGDGDVRGLGRGARRGLGDRRRRERERSAGGQRRRWPRAPRHAAGSSCCIAIPPRIGTENCRDAMGGGGAVQESVTGAYASVSSKRHILSREAPRWSRDAAVRRRASGRRGPA